MSIKNIGHSDWLSQLRAYEPCSQQEQAEKAVILQWAGKFPDTLLYRENPFAHLSSSGLIFNSARTKVLMVYHKIYGSWSFSGGHTDGDGDLLRVALREAAEETGLAGVTAMLPQIAAADILPVWGHVKNGDYVAAHLHLNVTYALAADEREPVRAKPDENSGVRWIDIAELSRFVTEAQMMPVYEKVIKRVLSL